MRLKILTKIYILLCVLLVSIYETQGFHIMVSFFLQQSLWNHYEYRTFHNPGEIDFIASSSSQKVVRYHPEEDPPTTPATSSEKQYTIQLSQQGSRRLPQISSKRPRQRHFHQLKQNNSPQQSRTQDQQKERPKYTQCYSEAMRSRM